MTVKISGKVLNASVVKARFAHLREEVPQLVSKENLGWFLADRIKARFIRGVDPEGNAWKPLEPSTHKGEGILRKTESLLQSIMPLDGAAGNLRYNTGLGFRIGVRNKAVSSGLSGQVSYTAVYGRFHQYGLGGNKKRAFMGISKLDAAAVGAKLKRDMRRLLVGI